MSTTVIFLPDEYLAGNVARETGRRIIFPTKIRAAVSDSGLIIMMIGWPGRCEVHEKFTVADIADIRKQFPDVVILAHPECSPEVVACVRLFRQHQRHDSLRRANGGTALFAADGMLDG